MTDPSQQQNTESLNLAALLESFCPVRVQRHALVPGKIVSIDKNSAWVNIGAKADSLVPVEELEHCGLTVGQTAEFLVVSEPDEDGQALLSARKALAWNQVRSMLAMNASESVTIKKLVTSRGSKHIAGAVVDIRGLRGFIPSSQLVTRGFALQRLVGTEVQVKVMQADACQGRLVLSERKAAEENKARVLAKIQPGQIVSGKVTNLVDFGAFVDIGGASGLVHRSELSSNRNAEPASLVTVGQELELVVLSVNTEKQQVALSLKQAAQARFLNSIAKDQVVTGVVARLTDFGAFVALSSCMDGLLHNSEIGNGHRDARSALRPGDTIEAVVIELDIERRKVGLSIRQLPAKSKTA